MCVASLSSRSGRSLKTEPEPNHLAINRSAIARCNQLPSGLKSGPKKERLPSTLCKPRIVYAFLVFLALVAICGLSGFQLISAKFTDKITVDLTVFAIRITAG